MTQPIVPPVFRTGNPLIDRNLDAIAAAFRRLQLSGMLDDHRAIVDDDDTPDTLEEKIVGDGTATVTKNGGPGDRRLTIAAVGDHKVATDATDQAAGGADYLLAKHANTGNVTFSLDTSSGLRRVSASASLAVPVASTTLPQPNGIAALGDEGKWADGKHVHPSQTHAAVKAFCGAQVALSGWTEGPTGTWTKDVNGSVSGTTWADDTALVTNDRIFLSDRVPNLTVVYDVQAGIYDLVNVGTPSTQAVIRRAADLDQSAEFTAGTSVYVDGGTDWGGKTLFLITTPVTVDVTEQRWGVSPTGAAAHTHAWSDLRPEGLAKIPYTAASLVDAGGGNGKLALADSNLYRVNPNSCNLTQIEVPTLDAGTTVKLTLVFTAPILVAPNVAPDIGYAGLHLLYDAAVTGIEFPNSYASMTFIYDAGIGAWLELEEHET